MKKFFSIASLVVLSFSFLCGLQPSVNGAPILITFDDVGLSSLNDITTQYSTVTFKGIAEDGSEVNLAVVDGTVFPDNTPPSLPLSLSSFYNHDPFSRAKIVRILFTEPVQNISLLFNGAGSLGSSAVFNAYDASSTLLLSTSVPAATDSSYHPANIAATGVTRLDILAPSVGWGFYLDNLQFEPVPVILGSVQLTFDDIGLTPLADVTTQYAARGVTFKGVTDEGAEVNLAGADNSVFGDNFPPSSPFSLSSFFNNDKFQRAHIVRILFSDPVNNLSLMFNGAGDLGSSAVFNAYDGSGALLSTFSVPSARDSEYHLALVHASNIRKLEIVSPGVGWGFYIDNIRFDPAVLTGTFLLTFDDIGLTPLADVTTQYAGRGVTFDAITDDGGHANLAGADNSVFGDNFPPSSPFSLSSFFNNDKFQRAHILRLLFRQPASRISLMFNGAGSSGSSAQFNAYDGADSLLSSSTVAAATDSDYHLAVIPASGVRRLDIVAPSSGWGFYIDNVQYDLGIVLGPVEIDIARAVAIGWTSVAGIGYQVQWASPLAPDSWSDLGLPFAGTGGRLVAFDLAENSNRFYRVVTAGPVGRPRTPSRLPGETHKTNPKITASIISTAPKIKLTNGSEPAASPAKTTPFGRNTNPN